MASKKNNRNLDNRFRNNVDHVQKHNGIHVFWDKEGVWKKITKALADSAGNPKMIAWYSAMAASISLLIASTITFEPLKFEYFKKKLVQEEAVIQIAKSDNNQELIESVALKVDDPAISIQSRQLVLSRSTTGVEMMEKLPDNAKTVYRARFVQAQKEANHYQKPTFNVGLSAGVSANTRYVMPKVDLGFAIDISSSEAIKKKLFIGTSVQFIRTYPGEQTNTGTMAPSYFIKSVYENEYFEAGRRKGWSTGAEFLIHTENDALPDNMLRIFYSRNIMGKLKVGPEVLFVKGFRKIYPGITLAVG